MRFGSAADLASDLNHVRRFAAGGFQKGTSTKNMHVRCQGPHEVDFSHFELFIVSTRANRSKPTEKQAKTT